MRRENSSRLQTQRPQVTWEEDRLRLDVVVLYIEDVCVTADRVISAQYNVSCSAIQIQLDCHHHQLNQLLYLMRCECLWRLSASYCNAALTTMCTGWQTRYTAISQFQNCASPIVRVVHNLVVVSRNSYDTFKKTESFRKTDIKMPVRQWQWHSQNFQHANFWSASNFNFIVADSTVWDFEYGPDIASGLSSISKG